LIIRKETPIDYEEVYAMVKKSFATSNHSDGTEQDYLNTIRKKDTFIPQLSLVAQINSKIVGQIVLYETRIKCKDRNEVQLVISPLSVHPDYFKQGVGAKLISEGCKRALENGYKAVFLCGDYAYYSKFGFVPTYKYEIYHKNDIAKNAEWCMVKELEKGFLTAVTGLLDIE
jgi:predicted N-acetyltransferase YhbS